MVCERGEGEERRGEEGRGKKTTATKSFGGRARGKNDVMGLEDKNVLWECHYRVFISV